MCGTASDRHVQPAALSAREHAYLVVRVAGEPDGGDQFVRVPGPADRVGEGVARSLGLLCARSGHDDVIDVHVALCARERGHAVATSDPDDMLSIDHALRVIKVLDRR